MASPHYSQASALFLVLTILTCHAIENQFVKNQNTKLCERFNAIAPHHSSCILSPPRVHEGLDETTEEHILDIHNNYRRQLRRYQQPAATNMQLMTWDTELAEVAQRWASNCMYQHDHDQNRAIPGRFAVGQNIAWTTLYDWRFTLMLWHNEYKDFLYGYGSPGGKNVGHYTQMVWATTTKLGCGYAFCNGTRHFYVCNYGPSGNINRYNDSLSKYKPYEIGSQMSQCNQNHKEGLCHCGGKVCLNGGTLDLHTCKCHCIRRRWIDQSRDCALDCTYARDTMVCKTNPRGVWGKEYCHKHFNVAREYCPVMCHWCPGEIQTFPPLKRLHNKYKKLKATLHKVKEIPGKLKEKPKKSNGENELLQGDQPQASKTTFRPLTTTSPTSSTPVSTTPSTTTPFKPTTNAPYLDLTAGSTLPPPCLKSESAKCGQPHRGGYYPPKYCTNPMVRIKCPAMCNTCSVSQCTDYRGHQYVPGQTWLLKYGRVQCTQAGAKFTDGCIKDFGSPKALFVSVGGRGFYIDGNYRYKCMCRREGNVKKIICRPRWITTGKRWS